jgi:hypothetical protein
MGDFPSLIIVSLLFLGTTPGPLQQIPTPQQQQQREEERRIEEEARRREAEERAREQEKLDQLQEDMERISRTVPMTPEELEVFHKRMFNQFVREVNAFESTSRELVLYCEHPNPGDPKAQKDIRKKARSLEGQIEEIMEYILGGEDEPDVPEVDFEAKPLVERLSIIKSIAPSIHQRLKDSYVSSKSQIIDANDAVTLLRDLQSMKRLSHSLR